MTSKKIHVRDAVFRLLVLGNKDKRRIYKRGGKENDFFFNVHSLNTVKLVCTFFFFLVK